MTEFYQRKTYGGIDVFYSDDLDGGGARFGQDFLSFLPEHSGSVTHVLEWCAGPGFIGFSLLAAGLCKKLTLIDINPAAVAACQQTIARNNLGDRVWTAQSDCFDALDQGPTFNLVVANPPHCPTTTPSPGGHPALLYNDLDWRIHRKFYEQVPRYLAHGGRVILQEDESQSNGEHFKGMIEGAGLEYLGTHMCAWAEKKYPPQGTTLFPRYYYVCSRLPTAAQEDGTARAREHGARLTLG